MLPSFLHFLHPVVIRFVPHVCKFPEHFIPLIVHFASLDTPFGCLSALKTLKNGIKTREPRGTA